MCYGVENEGNKEKATRANTARNKELTELMQAQLNSFNIMSDVNIWLFKCKATSYKPCVKRQ